MSFGTEILLKDSARTKVQFTVTGLGSGEEFSEAFTVGGHQFHMKGIRRGGGMADFYLVNSAKGQSVVVSIENNESRTVIYGWRDDLVRTAAADQFIPGGGSYFFGRVQGFNSFTFTLTVTLRQKPGVMEELGQKMTKIIVNQEKMEAKVAENQEKIIENQERMEAKVVEYQERMEARVAENQEKILKYIEESQQKMEARVVEKLAKM